MLDRVPTGSSGSSDRSGSSVDAGSGTTMRDELAGARRVVVKVGSSSLTTAEGGIDPQRIEQLVGVLARRGWPPARLSWSHPAPSQPACHRSDSRRARATSQLSKRLPQSVRVC